jgi:capsular exopolysaccharide synthesis family protein
MQAIDLKLPGENDFFTEEAYKVLRTNLQFCGQDVRVIAITSCYENEGKTTVALHVAKSFADLDKRVLLIDSDMRKSVMAGRNTSAQMHSGLSEVLTGMCPISECLYPVLNSKMHILFAGQYPPNPVELLSGKYFAALIAECRKVYDYIIIDTPPLGQVIDAAVIADKCDGFALVLGSAKVHYRMAQDVVEQISKSGCKMLGVIRNNRKLPNRKYYYRKYYRHDSAKKESE